MEKIPAMIRGSQGREKRLRPYLLERGKMHRKKNDVVRSVAHQTQRNLSLRKSGLSSELTFERNPVINLLPRGEHISTS